jgi:signal peptidase I
VRILNWIFSATVRHASHRIKHIRHRLNAQRDLLSPESIERVQEAIASLRQAIRTAPTKARIREEIARLEEVANTWLIAYPHPALRDNVEMLLVAIAILMCLRTFFCFQTFQIPTGSMQPTLYGITSNPDYLNPPLPLDNPSRDPFTIPGSTRRFFEYWFKGIQYKHVVARQSGALTAYDAHPVRFLSFNLRQKFYLSGDPKPYTVWFPPQDLLKRAGLVAHDGQMNPKVFQAGDDIMRIRVTSGDHLLVDRFTYNFRRPKRGEIVVFHTRGIQAPGMPQDEYYIKRLVALGGERVQIGNDRHLVIDGQRLDATTAHFENVYSFNPVEPPRTSQYSGHLNELVGRSIGLKNLAPLFPNGGHEHTVKPGHYMVMGDNTVNSYDSRGWGEFRRENVIGRCFFVYWPIGAQEGRHSRFGWGDR